MKCNLAALTLLSIGPASSLAPLAPGAFAIASALATQRLDTGPARGGRPGRRSRGRTGARTDRRAEKERRHPAPTAAVGLPEATAEIIASLGEHRVLSTEQVQTIHLPGRSLRRAQQILAAIEEVGLIHHVDTRTAPRRLWFVSKRGAAIAFELVGLETQPRVLQPSDAAGPLRAHTLAVNDAAICFLKAARERGDEFGPFSWRQEVAHPLSRGRGRRRTLFADAVLTYLRPEEDETVLDQRFLELDRATLSVDRLVAELSRYAQLYRATDAEGPPLWRNRYPVFPRVLCVLTGASREALTTRRTFASMLLRDHPAMAQARGEVSIGFCRLEDLQRKGPFAPIFREVRDPKRPVDWLGDSPDEEEGGEVDMRPRQAGSLLRRRRAIVVGQETDGRAAHKRPRPDAEGLSFGAMPSLEATGSPTPPGDRACRSSGAHGPGR